jgi:hypothetical protein
MKPLCIDLFCGLGGWAEGFLSEGYDVVGFDIERHDYGTGGYPGQLVLQDVLTLDGAQFKDAACIVASPPCTEFSYRGRYGRRLKLPPPSTDLFDACFRIQREANVPMVAENVVFAQEFVGSARAHWGAYYLWGDVPPMLPFRIGREGVKGDSTGLFSRRFGSKSLARRRATAEVAKIPLPLSSWIAQCFKPTIERVA